MGKTYRDKLQMEDTSSKVRKAQVEPEPCPVCLGVGVLYDFYLGEDFTCNYCDGLGEAERNAKEILQNYR